MYIFPFKNQNFAPPPSYTFFYRTLYTSSCIYICYVVIWSACDGENRILRGTRSLPSLLCWPNVCVCTHSKKSYEFFPKMFDIEKKKLKCQKLLIFFDISNFFFSVKYLRDKFLILFTVPLVLIIINRPEWAVA